MDFINFLVPSSSLTIGVALILLATVSIKILVDIKSARESRKRYNYLIKLAKKTSRKPVSVIIELNQAANKIIPLLDNLYGQKYLNLEVVIIIKHTAGKNALSKLQYYRRKNGISKLRLVKHSKGMTQSVAINRYVSSPWVVVLSVNTTKLSESFFEDISLDTLFCSGGVMALKRYRALDNSLNSALWAHLILWSNFVLQIRSSKVSGILPGFVYKRSLVGKNEKVPLSIKATASRASFVGRLNPENRARITRRYTVIALGGITVSFLAIFLLIGVEEATILILFAYAVYVTVHIVMQTAIKGYGSLDRINLLLFTPLVLPYALLVILAIGLRNLIPKIKRVLPKKVVTREYR